MATRKSTRNERAAQRRIEAAAAYLAGETMTAIAARYGCGVPTILRDLRIAGVESRGNRKGDIQPGSEFGKLTALEPRGEYWLCRCACGQEEMATSTALRQGHHVRCAACRKPEVAPEVKTCTTCKETKPNTPEFFHQCNQFRFGLKAQCKTCFVPKLRAEGLVFRRRLRLEVLTHYAGGEKPACKCCGEETLEFLCLDHLEGSSRADYKEHGNKFFAWLKRNDYPRKMQVLCHNCNEAKSLAGWCCVHHPKPDGATSQRPGKPIIPLPPVTEDELRYALGRTQECYGCRRTFPHSNTYFCRHKQMAAGLLNICKDCDRKAHSEHAAARSEIAKEKVFAHYSPGKAACAICGIADRIFLTVDHIEGGGAEHRREKKINNLYTWLVKNNFPPGYRLLCWNHNMGLGFYGTIAE